MMAWLLDMVLVTLLFILLAIVFGVAAAFIGDYATAAFFVMTLFLYTGYWVVLELWWDGRTIGKRAFSLRVVGERGLRLTFGQVALRNLLRFIDILPGPAGLGAIFVLFGRQHRRLGDLVAGTLVIRERRVPPPERIRVLAGGSARGTTLNLPADLGRRIPPAERDLLLDLCMRRDALDESVRHRLFEEVATHYRILLDVNQEMGISDEKLVLLLTSELYERLGAR